MGVGLGVGGLNLDGSWGVGSWVVRGGVEDIFGYLWAHPSAALRGLAPRLLRIPLGALESPNGAVGRRSRAGEPQSNWRKRFRAVPKPEGNLQTLQYQKNRLITIDDRLWKGNPVTPF